MLRARLSRELRAARRHWHQDAALGVAVGLAVAGPVLARLGVR